MALMRTDASVYRKTQYCVTTVQKKKICQHLEMSWNLFLARFGHFTGHGVTVFSQKNKMFWSMSP